MNIFSRFKDIINSNLNSMLEKAEDPEKLIKLMIQEMEDTLVEMKANCAGAMASRARCLRNQDEGKSRVDSWAKKAKLAMDKGREDLAREALIEKKATQEELTVQENEVSRFDELVDQYKKDIQQLEDKLASARGKHRILVERHIHAGNRKTAQTRIRNADSTDAFVRFEQFENRIERMEADADLINFAKKSSLDDEFAKLETDEEIEAELEALRKAKNSDK